MAVRTVGVPEDRRIPSIFMDNIFRRLFRPPEKLVTKYVQSGNIVVDLGCGPGYFTLPLASKVGDYGKVYAIDLDAKAIERLKKKATKKGFANTVESRASSASEIDFIKSDSIDFVLAEGLLCCMKDHIGAIRQIKRILKPEGEGRAYLSITKFSRRRDPRGVSEDEWARLLGNFLVLVGGESLTSRWALVSRVKNEEAGSEGDIAKSQENNASAACCYLST